MICCALLLLEAFNWAAVMLDWLAAVLPVLLTGVVAMGIYKGCESRFDTRTQNLNDQLM